MSDLEPNLLDLNALGSGRSRRSHRTRDRIVTAAARLFERNGYDATSMDDIAEEANITKPTVYYHFANKEALYTTICTQHSGRSNKYVDALAASSLTAAEKLVELIWNLVASSIHEQTTRLLFDSHVRVAPESRALIRAAQHRYVDAIADELANAQAAGEAFPDDPRLMALTVFESIGRTRRWFDPHGRVPSESAGPMIVRLFLRALLKEPGVERFEERMQAGGEGFFPARFSLIDLDGSGGGSASPVRTPRR
jgi:TetR/AcrR family transcriptional regulator, cholesterol catabolism regulator